MQLYIMHDLENWLVKRVVFHIESSSGLRILESSMLRLISNFLGENVESIVERLS